jgi:hypothetical protein
MITQIIAAIPPAKIGTSIATGFSHGRLVRTSPLYSHANTVTGKNKTARTLLTSTCLVSLAVQYLCRWAYRISAFQIGLSLNA